MTRDELKAEVDFILGDDVMCEEARPVLEEHGFILKKGEFFIDTPKELYQPVADYFYGDNAFVNATEDMRKDYEWLKEHDEFFSFKTFEEWIDFLDETYEDRRREEWGLGNSESVTA